QRRELSLGFDQCYHSVVRRLLNAPALSEFPQAFRVVDHVFLGHVIRYLIAPLQSRGIHSATGMCDILGTEVLSLGGPLPAEGMPGAVRERIEVSQRLRPPKKICCVLPSIGLVGLFGAGKNRASPTTR
ncbi:MAG: hypothetical protein ACREMY_12915, partial [bacterium]